MPLTIWNCVCSYKQKKYFSEIGLFFHEVAFITEFLGSNFCYPHFEQEANGIFRWQICFVLLLISNPASVVISKIYQTGEALHMHAKRKML